MSRRMKWAIAAGVVIVALGGLKYASDQKKKNAAVEVKLEPVSRKDLVAAVTASGRIEAETQVDISADVTGRILQIAVKEGDMVKKGQFLIQIDPAQFEGAVKRAEALLSSQQASLLQAQANRDQAKRQFDRAKELQVSNPTLIAAEAVEQAQQAHDVSVAIYETNVAQVAQARAALKEAQDNLNRTRLFAPISGKVTRLAVEEGEVAVPGTFSKDVGLLLTIADMGTIISKVQVDETDVVRVSLGDSVQVTIDAFPDTTFAGRVTKISNSAKLDAGMSSSQGGNQDRAVDFDVEITIDNPPADVRPDLSTTSRIITDTRTKALSIPIIALTVREHEPVPRGDTSSVPARNASTAPPKQDSAPGAGGKKGKEREGVFVVTDGKATFRPVKVGIAGDEYFEVIDGVREGETIVAGTYQAIRDLKDGQKVKAAKAPETKKEEKRS